MDGGVRSGQDVLKAVALGAKGVWIGRPFLYGLGAGGKAGVTRCLDIIRNELDVTMALCGKRDIRAVDRSVLDSDLATGRAPDVNGTLQDRESASGCPGLNLCQRTLFRRTVSRSRR